MNINFGGFVGLSTVDWFGLSTGVVFLRGCQLACIDCHNKRIIGGEKFVPLSRVKDFIYESKPLISGVVFTGGEPLLQVEEIEHLIKWCKKEDLKVYIHTSGFHPDNLERVIKNVDGVRLDYKPREQFPNFYDTYFEQFSESLQLVKHKKNWISSVALRKNRSLVYLYKEIGVNLVTQGLENYPKSRKEIKEEFKGVWVYTTEGGLEWNG